MNEFEMLLEGSGRGLIKNRPTIPVFAQRTDWGDVKNLSTDCEPNCN
jgi:hypothetical protein